VVISIPVAVIVAQRLMEQAPVRKWIWRLSLANLVVLLWLRLGLVYEPLFPGHFESHGNRQWVGNLKALADGAPVVFENSYRRASMYGFYSGQPSISLNNAYYRLDQFAIDGSEDQVQGQKVFYVYQGRTGDGPYYLDAQGKKKHGVFIENFTSYRNLKAGLPDTEKLIAGKEYPLWIYNSYKKPVPLKDLKIGVAYLDRSKRLSEVQPAGPAGDPEGTLAPGDTLRTVIRLPEPAKEGAFYVRAVLSENGLPWGINGKAQRINP
jgi:hypothetical protein